jgi:hypothetical protein
MATGVRRDAYRILRNYDLSPSKISLAMATRPCPLELDLVSGAAKKRRNQPVFEEKIWMAHKDKLRHDVIIRDMRSIDKYPNVDEKAKGISLGSVLASFHRGILVGLRWTTLTGMAKISGGLQITQQRA